MSKLPERQNVKRFLVKALQNPDRPEYNQLVAFDYFEGFRENEGCVVIRYMIDTVIGAPYMRPGSYENYELIVPIRDFNKENPNLCSYPIKYLKSMTKA